MLTAILSTILIHQLYSISVQYFHFDSHTIIDTTDYESDHNYLFVSIQFDHYEDNSGVDYIRNCSDFKIHDCYLEATYSQLFNKPLNDKIFERFYISSKNEMLFSVNDIKSTDSYYN